MSQLVIPTTTSATFVLRFWRETTAGEARWRGRIEHVQSGKRTDFLKLQDLLSFLEGFGIRPEDTPGSIALKIVS